MIINGISPLQATNGLLKLIDLSSVMIGKFRAMQTTKVLPLKRLVNLILISA